MKAKNISVCALMACALCLCAAPAAAGDARGGTVAASARGGGSGGGEHPGKSSLGKSSPGATAATGKSAPGRTEAAGKQARGQAWTFAPAEQRRAAARPAEARRSPPASSARDKGRLVYIKPVKSEPWTPSPKTKEDMQLNLGKNLNVHSEVNSETMSWRERKLAGDEAGADAAVQERRRSIGAYAEVKEQNLSLTAGPEYTFDSEQVEMGRVKSAQEGNGLGLGLQLHMGF